MTLACIKLTQNQPVPINLAWKCTQYIYFLNRLEHQSMMSLSFFGLKFLHCNELVLSLSSFAFWFGMFIWSVVIVWCICLFYQLRMRKFWLKVMFLITLTMQFTKLAFPILDYCVVMEPKHQKIRNLACAASMRPYSCDRTYKATAQAPSFYPKARHMC